jgi:uncharacterized Zn-finger protein
MHDLVPYYYKQIKLHLSLHILLIYLFPRCDASFGSFGMITEEVIPPLLSVEVANAPDEPDSDCVEKQKEQMGMFQTLERLEKSVNALLITKSSGSSSSLQQHLKAIIVKKLINCSICTKLFSNLWNLKTHMRAHTGEKPFSCLQCTKSFSHSFRLRSHLRVHTGDTTFACSVCTKIFGDSQQLQIHLRVYIDENLTPVPSLQSRFLNNLTCRDI